MSGVFHEGERAMQQKAGVADMARRVGNGIHAEMPPVAEAFLAGRDFIVLGSADDKGKGDAVWATLLTGPPGFVMAPDEHTVVIAALPAASDPLFARLTQTAEPAPVGLLAIDLTTRRRMRVNGDSARAGDGLALQVRQAYANCPKYIQRRDEMSKAGENEATRGTGRTLRTDALSDWQQAWIGDADTFFIATQHPTGGADVSHRGGEPGFARVLDSRTLLFPDYSGNAMFNTLGNLAVNPNAGLLWADWETGDTLQLTGRAEILWDAEAASQFAGAERVVRFQATEVVETKRAFALRFVLRERSPFNPR